MHRFLILFLTFLLAPMISAQDPFDGSFALKKETTSKVTPEVSSVEPGDFFRVAFTIDHRPHFHSYYRYSGIVGEGPKVEWKLPEGFAAKVLQYPVPTLFDAKTGGLTEKVKFFGYEGKVTFIAEIEAYDSLKVGESFALEGTFSYQECDEATCVMDSVDFAFQMMVGEETTFIEAHEGLFEKAADKLPRYSESLSGVAKENDGTILLEVSHLKSLEIEEPVYFFSSDGQVYSQGEQSVEFNEDGKGFILTLERNAGNEDLFISPAPVADTLEGMLTFQTGGELAAAEIVAPLETNADLDAVGHKMAFIPATEEQKKAGLELYDVDAKPDYLLLGGKREKSLTLLSALPLVFLGGLILNLMPCVFPVLGLKVMGFVSMAGEDESKIKNHGLVFGLGVLVTMWILAAFIIALGLNWGQQLSNPVFLGSIIIILFLMGLNLFGLFEFGTSMTGVGGELQNKKGYSGSFFSGALTTLIATPCSGPFLGLVIGFALSQGKVSAMVIFTIFALGIASPYIVLSFFPALIKKLPRPGAWMESFKQVMSFLVFATVVFFLGSYLKLVGPGAFQAFLFALTAIAIAIYVYGRWGTISTPVKKRRIVGYGIAAFIGFSGLALAFSTAEKTEEQIGSASKVGDLAWNEWYPGVVELSRKKKRIAWVDYTADW